MSSNVLTGYDFSGILTKANVKCRDGRVISPGAFAHQDGQKIPFVWHHGHNSPTNVLGYMIIKNDKGDVRAYVYFNNTEAGKTGREIVKHGDVDSLSVFANDLEEENNVVLHGTIREAV
jgi:hypothetical protein